jgi:alanine dehydrogenase
MKIGIPKEVKNQEMRVAMTPDGAGRLVSAGHQVLVEHNAGQGSGFSDAQYQQAGADIVSAADAWACDLVVKVKEPQPTEYDFLNGQILFTYLHLSGVDKKLTQVLLERKVTALAYETLENEQGQLPLLAPMSAVAGNMSVLMGNFYLARFNQGSGVLLAQVLGKKSGKVLVIGDGVVGQHAARCALALGAQVSIAGLDHRKFEQLEQTMLAGARFLFSDPENIASAVQEQNLVVGAVLIKGAKAPRVVTEKMVKQMQPGSVIVDVSIDQGGCIETSQPTTHSDPVFIKHGVIHYCVANMPGAYPQTSTLALTRATIDYIQLLADKGIDTFLGKPWLAKAINTLQGRIVYQKIAEDLTLMEYYQPL